MSKKILIIGSGIAGIAASLKLKSYGLSSTIVDKADFIGGRISTRIDKKGNNDFCFFHGAQFFTARSENFKKIIENGLSNNYIKRFEKKIPEQYRGFPTMRNFLIRLSSNLIIKQNHKVINIYGSNNKINVLYENTPILEIYDAVISTLPSPQNIELLKKFPSLTKTLSQASYDSCIALMIAYNKVPEDIPPFFDFSNNKKIINWMSSSNNNKCWTIHANPVYSNQNLNKNQLFIKNEMLKEVNKVLSPSKDSNFYQVIYNELHIWKYAKVKNIAKGNQIDPIDPIAIAGDFMEGPRVESAFISGEKAADLIFNRLKA